MSKQFGNPESFHWDGWMTRENMHFVQDLFFKTSRDLRWRVEEIEVKHKRALSVGTHISLCRHATK